MELVGILAEQTRLNSLSHFHQISAEISVTKISGISLVEYVSALPELCKLSHFSGCDCSNLLVVARSVLDNGFVKLAEIFRAAFPGVTYHSVNAKKKLLRMPLVAITVGRPSSGCSEVYLFENCPGMNYGHFRKALETIQCRSNSPELNLTKLEFKSLLQLATSDRERECFRYIAWKASGLSASGARRSYGFENMSERAMRVESCLEEIKEIREEFERLCVIQEEVALVSHGIEDSTDSSDSEGVHVDSAHSEEFPSSQQQSLSYTQDLLKKTNYNWFEVITLAEEQGISSQNIESQFDTLLAEMTGQECDLLVESHDAYCASLKDMLSTERDCDALNGDIVSESEDDNPDEYLEARSPSSAKGKVLLQKKIAAIRLKARRNRAKEIASRNYLQRKQSKRVSKILQCYPNIGKEMEEYVKAHSIGADAWRRTGVLTFDGNRPVKEKVTYDRIRKHLEATYDTKFSYGTVVQLCVARNKRRRSAARYKGVAQITTRRARKGFQLKYNPDSHWSSAFYRGLNFLQLTDGMDILNVNRDDAAGFRLDTLTTHKLHRTPVVKGNETLTTRTDYVNSYPSILQTTSYNFSSSQTTSEFFAGVVKGSGVYDKNPAQHSADFAMLESMDKLKPAFLNPATFQPKSIECIRVDGAADEGPSHIEVQFWWALRHCQKPTYATLVTSRNSGASYLNRVELQNGCLALAHANLFIPSNLNGSCFSPDTGKVDRDRLQRNMDLATDIYISRCNGAPCAGEQIHLFKGADSAVQQELRQDVLTFLKGKKTKKEELQREKPERCELFEEVWDIRCKHLQQNLPLQYAFFLVCCNSKECKHPLCRQQCEENRTWFTGGPPLSYLPFPVPDPERPWGGSNCCKCSGHCAGHYLDPATEYDRMVTLEPIRRPPSQVIKASLEDLKDKEPSDIFFTTLAKQTLLPTEEVRIWVQHLQTVKENRKRGAEKAAATRRKKKQALTENCEDYCQVCGKADPEAEDSEKDGTVPWIQCDGCDRWSHVVCVNVSMPIPDQFFCQDCVCTTMS